MEGSTHNFYADILYVEDQPEDAELVGRALEKTNLKLSFLRLKDGHDALDYLFVRGKYEDRDPYKLPRLIILDIKVPKISGLEVLKLLRQNPKTRRIPVIIFSSSDQPEDIHKAYEYGVSSYLVKPGKYSEMKNVIAQIVNYWLRLNVVNH